MKGTYLILVFFIAFLKVDMLCAQDERKSDQELLREFAQHWVGYSPVFQKYIYDVMYVGMPEDDFVKMFTWSDSFEGTLRPYITKKSGNIYYLLEPECIYLRKELKQDAATGKSRVRFEDGRLIKYEFQHWAKPPFVFLVYSDSTYSLRGFDDGKGFYDGMPEDEFVTKFSHSIVSYKKGRYVFRAENGKKYRVEFYSGHLFGAEPL